MASKVSSVWEFMIKNKDKKDCVDCSVCQASFVCKGSSTTSLRRHLINQHGISLSNKRESGSQSETVAGEGSVGSQPKLKQFIKSKEKLQRDSPRAASITSKVAKMIYKDLQPLSIIEDEGFRELLEVCEPRYVLPSMATFRNNIVPATYKDASNQLKSIIKAHKATNPKACYSLTTDGWTSRNPTSYVTYTLHLVIEHQVRSFVLATQELSEKHTAQNLTSHLAKTLSEWGIIDIQTLADNPNEEDGLVDEDNPIDPFSSVPLRELRQIVITTDNASNISKAIKDSGTQHVRCFAHTINLGVQKFISSISDHLARVRAIVKFFHRSPSAAAKLTVSVMQAMLHIYILNLQFLILHTYTHWYSFLH